MGAVGGTGGALQVESDGRATVTNCTFLENVADQGGAIAVRSGGSVTLIGCYARGNSIFGTFGGTFYVNVDGSVFGIDVNIVAREEPRDIPVSGGCAGEIDLFNEWYDSYFPHNIEFDFSHYKAVPSIVARIFSKFPFVCGALKERYVEVAISLIERWEEQHIDMKHVIGEETAQGHGENARRKITRILLCIMKLHYG